MIIFEIDVNLLYLPVLLLSRWTGLVIAGGTGFLVLKCRPVLMASSLACAASTWGLTTWKPVLTLEKENWLSISVHIYMCAHWFVQLMWNIHYILHMLFHSFHHTYIRIDIYLWFGSRSGFNLVIETTLPAWSYITSLVPGGRPACN